MRLGEDGVEIAVPVEVRVGIVTSGRSCCEAAVKRSVAPSPLLEREFTEEDEESVA